MVPEDFYFNFQQILSGSDPCQRLGRKKVCCPCVVLLILFEGAWAGCAGGDEIVFNRN